MTSSHCARAGSRYFVEMLVLLACVFLELTGPAGRGASPQRDYGLFHGQTDVGVTPKPGSLLADPATDTYTVTGGGANMWGTTDAFHFIWRRWKGDVTLTAHVKILTATGNAHRKAGLMIRQGLGPSDAFADALLHGSGLTALQYRETKGATTLEVESPISSPAILRLVRRGNTFTLSVARNGGDFEQVGSATVNLQDPVYVGLAVCSHDADALTTARFTHVELSGPPTDAPRRVPRLPKSR
jgi:TolB protein